MFSVNDREHIRDCVLHLASADSRIVAGAVVGSLARALGEVIDGLLREAEEVQELAAKVGPQLRQLQIGGRELVDN
jgi:hypothetical protein